MCYIRRREKKVQTSVTYSHTQTCTKYMCNCIFMCLYITYNYLLWIHTCIQLALIHQVCASGLGCCGAGCGLSWSWMWVIMVLGVGCRGAGCGLLGSWMWVIMVLGVDCRGAGCGSSWCWVWIVVELDVGHHGAGCGKCSKLSAGHKALQPSAVVGCPSPLETLSVFLGRVAGNVIQLSAVVGCPPSSWNPVRLSWECRRQCNPTLSSSRMHPSSGNFVRLSWEGRRQCNPTLCAAGCPRLLETLFVFLGRVAGNAIQLSAVVGCPSPLETLSVFLGRVTGNAVSDWSSLASALLKIVLRDPLSESGKGVGGGVGGGVRQADGGEKWTPWMFTKNSASFRGETLKHLSEGMGEVRQAEGGGKRTCWTSMTNVQHWSIFQRGWGKWGRQREEGSEHVERLWQMSNTEASFRGDGGSEAGRGRREANMLNVYDKCPTLKHLSQEIVLIALPLLF